MGKRLSAVLSSIFCHMIVHSERVSEMEKTPQIPLMALFSCSESEDPQGQTKSAFFLHIDTFPPPVPLTTHQVPQARKALFCPPQVKEKREKKRYIGVSPLSLT